jgi:hypothetical protein
MDQQILEAPDQHCLAAVTVRTLALGIVNIAGVDVAQPDLLSDASRHAQRRGRRRRRLQHLPVRVKGGKVQRHVGAQALYDPVAQRADLGRRVVLAGTSSPLGI